jgi:hypothetical protein
LCIHAGASLFTCAAGFCWNLFALKIRFKKTLENLEKKRKSARLGGLLAERPTSPIPTSYFADSLGPRVSSLSSTFLLPVPNRIGNRPLNPF